MIRAKHQEKRDLEAAKSSAPLEIKFVHPGGEIPIKVQETEVISNLQTQLCRCLKISARYASELKLSYVTPTGLAALGPDTRLNDFYLFDTLRQDTDRKVDIGGVQLIQAKDMDLFESIKSGSETEIKQQLQFVSQHAPDLLDTKDAEGRTLLHQAAYYGKGLVAKWLFARRPHFLDLGDQAHRTPLILSAFKLSDGAAQLLLSAKANANAQDSAGRTTLHWSIRNMAFGSSAQGVAMLKVLRQFGADNNITDEAGHKPSDQANHNKEGRSADSPSGCKFRQGRYECEPSCAIHVLLANPEDLQDANGEYIGSAQVGNGLADIEEICAEREFGGQTEYRLKFKGFSNQHNIWKKAKDMEGGEWNQLKLKYKDRGY